MNYHQVEKIRIGGVIVSVLVSSAAYRGLSPGLVIQDYSIRVCCFYGNNIT